MAPSVVMTEDLFRQAHKFQQAPPPKMFSSLTRGLSCSVRTLLGVFPILQWLPLYDIRANLFNDVVAGITVSILHIPHGLAFAQLGGIPPVGGLYMAVFPPLVYVLMGTSRHISLGTFAILCVMAGKCVDEHEEYPSAQVAVAVAFTVGMWQCVLGVLRLGALSVILSGSLVSGFTSGAAIHVASIQLKNLVGVEATMRSGPLKLFYYYKELVMNITQTNLVTLSLALVCLVVLFTFNEYLKPKIYSRYPKLKVPFPIELTVIAAGIITSYYLDLNKVHGVKIVANVPTGLPMPQVPPLELLPALLVDGFVMAIVATSINLSLASIFAKRGRYTVVGNQELLAYGCGNILGSFFHCLPVSASLSRTSVQYSAGGRTQLALIFCISVIVLTLLFIGPLFEPVPYCVLSAIVVATLKGLVMQITDFPKIYRQSTLDGLVWALTFCSVVFIDLDYGLLIGIVASVGTMLVRGYRPTFTILGQVPNTNVFLDADRYKATVRLPHVTIVHISGGLNFANAELANAYIIQQTEELRSVSADKTPLSVVVSMAAVAYMDPTAVSMLTGVYKDLKAENCDLYLAEMSVGVYDSLEHCGFFKQFPTDHAMATVFDAVEYLIELKCETQVTS